MSVTDLPRTTVESRPKGLFSYGRSCDTPIADRSAALHVERVSHRYPGAAHQALEEISIEVKRGDRVALMGPNGAGKSTLIKLAAGLLEIQTGSIRVHGNPAGGCRHRITLVPQRNEVDWRFPVTVRQVVMMGRYVHLGWLRRPAPEDHDAVERAMEMMKITNLASSHIGELSGGQQQRVMLARALAHDADVLLLDEPLNHVDVATQELMFHVLERLCETEGKTAIVSTHDLGVLKVHFNRAIFLDHRLIADGPIEEIVTAETIAQAYGFEFHGGEDLSKWLNG
jgi:ABC-type Mn2+/Zn2+ transport system ATPase subunit